MIFKKLSDLANQLDDLGLHEEADQVDSIIREAGIMDWFKPKSLPTCTCNCEQCEYGKNAVTRPQIALTHHKQCATDACEIKAAI